MFIFEYDQNYNILRISNAFIPTNEEMCHKPFLLSFPCGFIEIQEDKQNIKQVEDELNYIASYGEGDVRSKLIMLSHQNIEKLLIPISQMNPQTFDFKLLIIPNKQLRIAHIGYFHNFNCGDDAFRHVFEFLKKTLYPTANT